MTKNKNTAITAYITIVGTFIAISMNSDEKSSFNSFHIRQALGLFISFFAFAYIVGYFNNLSVTFSFYLCFLVLWIYGFLGAIQGKENEIPLFGKLFQKVFKSL